MKIKNFLNFIKEQNQNPPVPAPPPAQNTSAPAPPPAQNPPAQPAAQLDEQQPAETGTTQTNQQPQQPVQGEQKSGDLSNYNNPDVTNFPETVRKMVDIIKELNKDQLIKLRDLLAEFKSIDDAKEEIGKL